MSRAGPRVLLVEGLGRSIRYRGGVIEVRDRGTLSSVHSPGEFDLLVITGRVAVTSDAIRALSSRGTDVLFMTPSGRLYARISFPELRTSATRRAQYCAEGERRGGILAREIVRAKLRNQMGLLRTLAKDRPEISDEVLQARESMANLLERLSGIDGPPEVVRGVLLGMEGEAAARYWGAVSRAVPPGFGFPGRRTRGARDTLNAALNYGYAILMGFVWRAVHMAGLDPYAGFLHAERPGRPSMVLDLMEEFRQQVVDRRMLALVGTGALRPEAAGEGALAKTARRRIAGAVLERLDDRVQYAGERTALSTAVQEQARGAALFLRGNRDEYRGFHLDWRGRERYGLDKGKRSVSAGLLP
ncbi:MAG: CRISPR-associated endonuclease Cas1 [Conexivisphaera sp.]